MAVAKKANKAEKLAKSNQEVAHAVVDHVVGLQERNVCFAQSVVDSAAQELREQAEANRAVTQELVDRAENQRGAFQTVVQESVDAYTDLLYAPFSYYKQGLETVRKAS